MSPPRIHRTVVAPSRQPPLGGVGARGAPRVLGGGLEAAAPVKRPSRLLALTNRLAYRSRLHAHRRARAEAHRQTLLAELANDPPDARAVRRAFRRFSAAGRGRAGRRPLPPVAPEDERPAVHQQLQRVHQGIGRVLPHFAERSHTARYLRLLQLQLAQQWHRVESVVAYEHHRAEVLTQLRADKAPRPSDMSKLSDDGAGGAVFLGTRLKDPQRVLAKERAGPSPRALARRSSESSRVGSSSDDEGSVQRLPADPLVADPPPIERLDPPPARDTAGFAVASPRRKAVRIEAVVKLERPELALDTMRVHGVLDQLACTAPIGLPFGFGQHLLEAPSASLLQRMRTAEAAPDRQTQLEQLQAFAANERVVIRQEPIEGVSVNKLAFADRVELLMAPRLCRSIGSMLVIAPLVGLHDHLSLDGCGNNNWSNLMLTPAGGLSVIDLAPSGRATLDAGSLDTLEALVAGLDRLARHTGPDGQLPADWRSALLDTLRDFWRTTFTADGGLFSDSDFLPPGLAQEQQHLRDHEARVADVLDDLGAQLDALAADDPARPGIEDLRRLALEGQATIRARLTELENISIRASNALLTDLRTRALPHLVGGLVDGIRWAIGNTTALLRARSPEDGIGPAADLAQTRKALDILARLSPATEQRLARLQGVEPPEASRLRV